MVVVVIQALHGAEHQGSDRSVAHSAAACLTQRSWGFFYIHIAVRCVTLACTFPCALMYWKCHDRGGWAVQLQCVWCRSGAV